MTRRCGVTSFFTMREGYPIPKIVDSGMGGKLLHFARISAGGDITCRTTYAQSQPWWRALSADYFNAHKRKSTKLRGSHVIDIFSIILEYCGCFMSTNGIILKKS